VRTAVWREALVIVLGCISSVAGTHTPVAAQAVPEHPLVPAIREVLRRENPRIDTAEVLEVKTVPRGGPTVAVGLGHSDAGFQGDFRDELFGIFVVDTQAARVLRTLQFIPTPRWGDYEFTLSG